MTDPAFLIIFFILPFNNINSNVCYASVLRPTTFHKSEGEGDTQYPFLIHFFHMQWLPESARFHATSGDSEKALATLQKIAEENGKG